MFSVGVKSRLCENSPADLYFYISETLTICFFLEQSDQSIGSTKTKYIKLNTKTQILFFYLNENLMTFLYTLIGATRKQKEKKSFLFKVYSKVECY